MPSTSKKQHNFMMAIAKNPAFAKKVGIPQSVGEDFATADKGKKFKSGGLPERINKPKTHHTDGGVPNLSVKKYAGLKGGGMASIKEARMEPAKMEKVKTSPRPQGVAKTGSPKGKAMPDFGPTVKDMSGAMKKGGKVKKMARGGGIESKGKTRGKYC